MTARLRFFEEAAEEVELERIWYRRRSESAEAAFLRELDRAIAAVMEAPSMWPSYVDGTQRYVFPKFPFSLVYFVEDDVVVIVSVAAEHKKPGYWRDRLPGPRS
jgi:plasmid stabilization system protein ParE